MERIIHWFTVNASMFSVLVTIAIVIFLVCGLKCSECPGRGKDTDELFKKRNL